MKTIYVLTSKYMPLIEKIDFLNLGNERLKRRLVHTQDITPELLNETFANSKPRMLAFNSKEEAAIAMVARLKPNNTTPEYIDGEIPFFAVPVVFTAEIEDNLQCEESKNLSGAMLFSYLETDSIPLCDNTSENGFFKESAIKLIDLVIEKASNESKISSPKAFSINKEDIVNKTEARYFAANPIREALIHLSTAKADLKKIKKEEAAPMAVSPCVIL